MAETPTPPPTTPTPPAATGSSGANQWIVVEAAHCTAEIRRSDDEMACRDAEADWIGDRWGCSDGSTKTQEQCVSSTTGGGGYDRRSNYHDPGVGCSYRELDYCRC